MTRWGKAGVPRDPGERERRAPAARARANKRRIEEQEAEETRRVSEQHAHGQYLAGELAPWRITQCLNAAGLYGPEVDEACGAAEPDVDRWEAGVLYPTWEQVLLLAELCHVTPRFLMTDWEDARHIDPTETTMRFHDRDVLEEHQPPVRVFTREAIAWRLDPEPAPVVPLRRP